MNVRNSEIWNWVCSFLLLMLLNMTTTVWAASASLLPSVINVEVAQVGSFIISGNDDRKRSQFQWTLPAGLNVTKGSSSNLSIFDLNSSRGYVTVESRGRGAFSATINVSSNSAGTYRMSNTIAAINLNPKDVSVNVASGAGSVSGGSTNTDYTLYIETGFVSLSASPDSGNGAATIPSWGYTDVNGGNGRFPGVMLESVEGGSFSVEVINHHNVNHNFVVQGVSVDTTIIPPGGSRIYTVNTPTAGVYLYSDTLNKNVNRALGLFGGLVVRAANSSQRAWENGPRYDQERLWVINDLDRLRWTDVAFIGNNVNTQVYKPNYFFMNGLNGFAGMQDSNSTLEGNVGDVLLVRIVNAGQFDQSLHFHSNHFLVLSRGGVREGSPPYQDTINVKAGSTAMVLYTLNQPGHYPMHVHTAQMETGNGVYLNGTATMIIAH